MYSITSASSDIRPQILNATPVIRDQIRIKNPDFKELTYTKIHFPNYINSNEFNTISHNYELIVEEMRNIYTENGINANNEIDKLLMQIADKGILSKKNGHLLYLGIRKGIYQFVEKAKDPSLSKSVLVEQLAFLHHALDQCLDGLLTRIELAVNQLYGTVDIVNFIQAKREQLLKGYVSEYLTELKIKGISSAGLEIHMANALMNVVADTFHIKEIKDTYIDNATIKYGKINITKFKSFVTEKYSDFQLIYQVLDSLFEEFKEKLYPENMIDMLTDKICLTRVGAGFLTIIERDVIKYYNGLFPHLVTKPLTIEDIINFEDETIDAINAELNIKKWLLTNIFKNEEEILSITKDGAAIKTVLGFMFWKEFDGKMLGIEIDCLDCLDWWTWESEVHEALILQSLINTTNPVYIYKFISKVSFLTRMGGFSKCFTSNFTKILFEKINKHERLEFNFVKLIESCFNNLNFIPEMLMIFGRHQMIVPPLIVLLDKDSTQLKKHLTQYLSNEVIIALPCEEIIKILNTKEINLLYKSLLSTHKPQLAFKLVTKKIINVNKKTKSGETILSEAVSSNNLSLVKEILTIDKVYALNYKSGENKFTPLMQAIKNKNTSIAKCLLSMKTININIKDKKKQTALMIAAQFLPEVLSKMLEMKNVKLNCTTGDSENVLHYAAYGNSLSIPILFKQAHLNINERGKYGTPLNRAILNNNYKNCVALLKNDKIRVNTRNYHDSGHTPLINAVIRGYYDLVELLLETGRVKIDKRDSDLRTPLMHAAIKDKLKCTKILLKYGPDLTLTDRLGNTAVYYAKHYNNHCLNLLKEALKNREIHFAGYPGMPFLDDED